MKGLNGDYRTFWIFCLSVIWTSVIDEIFAIDCFKCVSMGGNNPACEDPFHNNYTTEILETSCLAGRKNRNGLFPATACIKLSGVYRDSGETMVVRDCALDSGTLTIDTEIVRMSHCGSFVFEKKKVSGCLQSCIEDACNSTIRSKSNIDFLLLFLIIFHFSKHFNMFVIQ